MNIYVIEREIPGIGHFSQEQYKAAAQKSNKALAELGDGINWQHSYIVEDQTFCIYEASGEEIIRKHSEITGFPANRIHKIMSMMDPSTGD
jgi:hypothetical protein